MIPSATHTFVSISGLREHDQHFQAYVQQKLTGMFRLLRTVESWMIHATDHWFIAPEEWDAVPLEIQRHLLDDIITTNLSIAADYQYGIFRTFRRALMKVLEDHESISEPEKAKLRAEQEELTMSREVEPSPTKMIPNGATSEE